MKIVNIMGGLGNQMFQYALALSLRNRFPDEEILIDSSGFKGYPLHNGYELKRIFNVDIPEASVLQQMKLFYPLRNYRMWQIANRFFPRRKSVIYESKDMRYESKVIEHPASAYYLGYWQTERYFNNIRPKILNAFCFPSISRDGDNSRTIELLRSTNATSVHVRRGDYVNISNTQGICNLNYYKSAISFIKEKANPELYLVFSDEIAWCKEHLSDYFGYTKVIYVDWNRGIDSYRDMQLMSCCNHNIIANSSFSWWGAWLNQNPDKIVVSPSRWMNEGGWTDMIPVDWIRI